jgi:dephospho-CoA kinase
MIIEFTGAPGAGKSLIINMLLKKHTTNHLVIDIESYIQKLFFISLPGTIGYDITLLFNFYRLKYPDYILILKSIIQLYENKNILRHKINIFRNIFKKLVINRILLSKNECFIVDEGISHIPISLFVDIDTEINISKTEAFYKYLPQLNKVILIDVDHKSLVERVIKRGERGHARIDFSNKNNIESFMLKSRAVMELSKKKLNPKIYYNNCKNIDLEKIIELMGIKNV